jgi:hypothetical protein
MLVRMPRLTLLLVPVLLAALGAPAIATDADVPAVSTAPADPWPAIRADYLAGNYPEAVTALQALVAKNPSDREGFYYLAMIYWREGDDASAATAFRQVLLLDPEGPLGRDATAWLASYAPRPSASPTSQASPTAAPGVEATTTPSPLPEIAPIPRSAAAPRLTRPWLQALPQDKGHRARSANPRPGYFKASDGSFEFKPPRGFVLLDEGTHGNEQRLLFGPPTANADFAAAAPAPPTLLITWHEVPELASLKPDQRIARERQLLALEASGYALGGVSTARYGVPCYRVLQHQPGWAAETLLFFKNERLYAMTYGGAASRLGSFRKQVEASWKTPIFYH